jgi:hypothetical protein
MSLFTAFDLRRLGHITVAWGVIFAVVHAYWAAGGAAGTDGDPADTAPVQIYIAFIAALGLVGAGVADALVHERTGRPGRRALSLLARAAGVALLAGVAVGVGRWLIQGGLADDGATGIAITLYFLVGGLLFSALGWRRAPARARAA